MEFIPTRFKDKLPKKFSYPLGAKEISENLIDVPQYSNLSLWFHFKDEFWASSYNKRLREGAIINIIEVKYYRLHRHLSSPHYFVQNEAYEPHGEMRINAVPRKHRFEVNKQLTTNALPIIVNWLKNIGLTNEYKTENLSFGFDFTNNAIVKISDDRNNS